MRQVGILGAAGHFALDNNIARLAEDHLKAKILAEQIHNTLPSAVDPKHVQSNIVGLNLVESHLTAADLAVAAKKSGVLIGALGPRYARLVTHLDVTIEQAREAAEIISTIVRER